MPPLDVEPELVQFVEAEYPETELADGIFETDGYAELNAASIDDRLALALGIAFHHLVVKRSRFALEWIAGIRRADPPSYA